MDYICKFVPKVVADAIRDFTGVTYEHFSVNVFTGWNKDCDCAKKLRLTYDRDTLAVIHTNPECDQNYVFDYRKFSDKVGFPFNITSELDDGNVEIYISRNLTPEEFADLSKWKLKSVTIKGKAVTVLPALRAGLAYVANTDFTDLSALNVDILKINCEEIEKYSHSTAKLLALYNRENFDKEFITKTIKANYPLAELIEL